jgi:hypothetical protein
MSGRFFLTGEAALYYYHIVSMLVYRVSATDTNEEARLHA